jgi:hypothetical protein
VQPHGPARRVHFPKTIYRKDFDKQKVLETIQEDSEGEATEEVEGEKGEKLPRRRQATKEEVEDKEDALLPLRTEIYVRPEDAWPYMHTNSGGARATPSRGVTEHPLPPEESTANHQVPEATEEREGEELSMWWAKVERQERSEEGGHETTMRRNSVGVSTTPARGVQNHNRQETSSADSPNVETPSADPNKWRTTGEGNRSGKVGESQEDGTIPRTRDLSEGQRDPRQGSTS